MISSPLSKPYERVVGDGLALIRHAQRFLIPFLLMGCATIHGPPPPGTGSIDVPISSGRELIVSLNGDDFMPNTLFIALDALTRKGFVPLVEEGSVRQLSANLKKQRSETFWMPDGATRPDVESDYLAWLERLSIPTNAVYFTTCQPSSRSQFVSPPPKPIQLVKRRSVKAAPQLRITSDYREQSYTPGYPGQGRSLYGSQRKVDLYVRGNLTWTKEFEHITFPSSFTDGGGDIRLISIDPHYRSDDEFISFLDRLAPSGSP